MMKHHIYSQDQIETTDLPGPSAVICMADSVDQLAVIKDSANIVSRLNLIFNDATEAFQIVRPPSLQDAETILRFVNEQRAVPNLVIQCRVGVGRSHAVFAALSKAEGTDPKPILHRGTYNRKLYRLMLAAAGLSIEPEPLISIAVRVKYSPERLNLFLLSMRRQRYDNWEVIGVTDGPNEAAARLVETMQDKRVRLIQTEKPLGHWGHPYRQLGLDACRGEFIGMSNDDNYYVPGYLEQMVNALDNADLAVCQLLHNYSSWSVVDPGQDIGAWIARASLIRQVPWTGNGFDADREYLQSLANLAAHRHAVIDRPLFVHN